MNKQLVSFFNRLFPKRFTAFITLGKSMSELTLFEKQAFHSNIVLSKTIPNKDLQNHLSQWINKPENLMLAIFFKEPDISTTQVFIPPGLDGESMEKSVSRELNIFDNHTEDSFQYRLIHKGDFEDTAEVSIVSEWIFNRIDTELGSWKEQIAYIGNAEHLPGEEPHKGNTEQVPDIFSMPLNHADKNRVRALKKNERQQVIQPMLQTASVLQLLVLIVISAVALHTHFSLEKAAQQFELKQAGFLKVQQLKKEQDKLKSDLNLYEKMDTQKSTTAFFLYELEKSLSVAVTFTSLQIVNNEYDYQAVISGQTTSEPELYRMLDKLKKNPAVSTVHLNKITRRQKEYAQFNLELKFN